MEIKHQHQRSASCIHMRRSFWNTCCHCLFSFLPDDVIVFNIFSCLLPHELLGSIAPVCRRWSVLAHDRYLWREVDVKHFPSSPDLGCLVDPESFRRLLCRHGYHVLSLNVCSYNAISYDFLQALTRCLPNLTSLHLCNLVCVDDSILASIGQHCPRLRHLSIRRCRNVTDQGVEMISKRLLTFSCDGCQQLGPNTLETIPSTLLTFNAGGCSRIWKELDLAKPLNFSQCRKINLHGIQLSDEIVELLVGSCKYLESVVLSSTRMGLGNSLTDVSMQYLSQLEYLNSLSVRGNGAITDNGLNYLSYSKAEIAELALGGCSKITDVGLRYIMESFFESLNDLNLFRCKKVTDESIQEMGIILPSLKHLDIRGCGGLTGISLEAFVTGFDSLQILEVSTPFPARLVEELSERRQDLQVMYI